MAGDSNCHEKKPGVLLFGGGELHHCTSCDAFPVTNTMREQGGEKWNKLIIQSDSELQ